MVLETKEVIDKPLFIFIFQLMEILARSLRDSLNHQCIDLLSEKEKVDFLRKIEWNLLSRKAWKQLKFKEETYRIYKEIVAHYGEFL